MRAVARKGEHMATEAYCVKCRTKRVMKDEKQVTMKNGKPATQGICPTCGTKMFKIGKSK
jgi:RNase P subunit RPR2